MTPEMPRYAGVGSRRTPPEVCAVMTAIAAKFARLGWVLRSGAAEGADAAFEAGANGRAEVFTAASPLPPGAFATVDHYHPAPGRLNPYARRLQARNALQVFGADLRSPVSCVVCWTPDGADGTTRMTSRRSGGTGQAIRLAAAYGIPVHNLEQQDEWERWNAWLRA